MTALLLQASNVSEQVVACNPTRGEILLGILTFGAGVSLVCMTAVLLIGICAALSRKGFFTFKDGW